MSWVEWVAVASLALGFTGLVVTIGGFALALHGLRRTKEAAEAARDAIRYAAERLAANQLLVLVPALQQLDAELDSTIQGKDTAGVERVLVRWRHASSQVRGLLTRIGGHEDLITRLQTTAALATVTKGNLKHETRPIHEATGEISGAISDVCDEITALVGQLATDPGDGVAGG